MRQVLGKAQMFRWVSGLILLSCVLAARAPLAVSSQSQAAVLDEAQSQAAANADLLLIFHENALNQAAQQLIGLEFTLANGAVLQVTALRARLLATGVELKLDVQAQAAPAAKTIKLQLTGWLASATTTLASDGALQLPFKLTDIALANGALAPLLKAWLGDWLTPERWNAALPPLRLPKELTQTLQIPAAQFEVKGQLPMQVTTAAYQLPLKFTPTALFFLEGRAVVALRLEAATVGTSVTLAATSAIQTDLSATRDLRARLSRNLLTEMLARLAAAREDDIQLQLQPARVRQEQPGGLLNVTNYTDVESGTARADVRQLVVERIDAAGIATRLQAQGVFDTKVRGREYGIPYSLSPRGLFAISDRPVPLRVASDEARVFLQAVPGTLLPLDLRFQFGLAGREIGFNRQVQLPAERLFSQMDIPTFYLHKLPLPRKLSVNQQGQLSVNEQRELNFQLGGLQLRPQNDAVEFSSNLAVQP